jgi:TIR domain
METDLFISHASEDKDEVARPLAEELSRRGFRVWYDEYSLQLGDSLRQRIDEGLANCTYGLVIISPSFMAKPWPNREVNGLVALETQDGRKRILPVWHLTSAHDVSQWSPTIADLKAVTTDNGLDVVADEIARVLRTEELRSLLDIDRRIRAVAAELDVRLCDDPGVGWAGWSIWPESLDTHLRYLNKVMLELDSTTARLNAYQVDRDSDRERRDLEQLARNLRDTADRYYTGTIATYRASSGEVLPIPPTERTCPPPWQVQNPSLSRSGVAGYSNASAAWQLGLAFPRNWTTARQLGPLRRTMRPAPYSTRTASRRRKSHGRSGLQTIDQPSWTKIGCLDRVRVRP